MRMRKYIITRAEEKLICNLFKGLFEIIALSIIFIWAVLKGLYEGLKYIRRYWINHKKVKKIGYSYNEIFNIIHKISDRQFEIFCAELFKANGHKAELTSSSGDYGRDVIVDTNIFIECKHYGKSNFIGREICQKLLGSMTMFGAAKGIIITTGTYHKNAYEVESMVENLELWDEMDLWDMIVKTEPQKLSNVLLRTLNAS